MFARLARFAVRTLDRAGRIFPKNNQPAEHLVTGQRGEEEAYFHLRRLGYVIVARNYRSPRHRGELDLVGWDGEVLCFIEVKTRTSREVKPAEAAVDRDKQRDLAAVARSYLRRNGGRPSYRFDVVSIYFDQDTVPAEITLFKNAFSVA
jgi:putative endonuclease